jgi:hypothetical protein
MKVPALVTPAKAGAHVGDSHFRGNDWNGVIFGGATNETRPARYRRASG